MRPTRADDACLAANLSLVVVCWAGLVGGVWLAAPGLSWWWSVAVVSAALVASGYLVERLLSGWVNAVVPRLIR